MALSQTNYADPAAFSRDVNTTPNPQLFAEYFEIGVSEIGVSVTY
jgi:hypothetical protein